MKLQIKAAAIGALAASIAAMPLNAAASTMATFSKAGPNNIYGIEFGNNLTPTNPNVSAEATISLFSVTDDPADSANDWWKFSISLTNTSVDSSITALTFNSLPDLLDATVSGSSSFTRVLRPGGLPGSLTFDACLTGSTGTCQGGNATAGVQQGATDSFFFSLLIPDSDNLKLSDFFVRYQSIGADDLSAIGSGTVFVTPLPGAAYFMLTGLAMLGWRMRRAHKSSV